MISFSELLLETAEAEITKDKKVRAIREAEKKRHSVYINKRINEECGPELNTVETLEQKIERLQKVGKLLSKEVISTHNLYIEFLEGITNVQVTEKMIDEAYARRELAQEMEKENVNNLTALKEEVIKRDDALKLQGSKVGAEGNNMLLLKQTMDVKKSTVVASSSSSGMPANNNALLETTTTSAPSKK